MSSGTTFPALTPGTVEPTLSRALNPESERFFRAFIQRESGIQLGEDKQYLIYSRIAPVLSKWRIASLDELCLRLQGNCDNALRREIVESLTTHETLFFRDVAVYEVLRTTILPAIASRRLSSSTIRIWSAACSSGQEPYSLAMLLVEMGLSGWNIQITATDLSNSILERARSGVYLSIEVARGLSEERLSRHFDVDGQEFRIKDELRRFIRFQQADLRQAVFSLEPFDLILCRNVLIYFDGIDRTRVLENLSRSLAPGGVLLLGSSETTFSFGTGFVRRAAANAVYYEKPV